MKKVTPKKLEKYLKHGSCCPACGSYTINGDSLEVHGNVVYQNCDCIECGLMWTDEYRLSGINCIAYAEEEKYNEQN